MSIEERRPLPGVEKAVERESARQGRLLVVFLGGTVLAIAAAVAFALFGRSDAELIRDEAAAEVEEVILGPPGDGPPDQPPRNARKELRRMAEFSRTLENLEWQGKTRPIDEVVKGMAQEQAELRDANQEVEKAVSRLRETVKDPTVDYEKAIAKLQEANQEAIAKLEAENARARAELLVETEKKTRVLRAEHERATAALQAENLKLGTSVKEAEARQIKAITDLQAAVRKTFGELEGWQGRVKALTGDLQQANERIKKLEGGRVPVPLQGEFDLKEWQGEIDRRMQAVKPNEVTRNQLLILLRGARTNHGIYSKDGTISVKEALVPLDARLRRLRGPR